ncbi:unnamed protein product, partial [Ceratitis capitata]
AVRDRSRNYGLIETEVWALFFLNVKVTWTDFEVFTEVFHLVSQFCGSFDCLCTISAASVAEEKDEESFAVSSA